MLSFSPNDITTDPIFLFGRNQPNQLLDQLLVNIQRKDNFQLLGERRSGKTSTLACLVNRLAEASGIIPVELNFKTASFIKGNANVFRYIASKCVSSATNLGIFKESISVRGYDITPKTHWEDLYEFMLQINDFRICGVLEDILINISLNSSSYFLLLLDEYEYLFTNSFENPQGFFAIREISNRPDKPMMFIISGATRWDILCSRTGSAELNNLGAGIHHLPPLKNEDFLTMWNHCLGGQELGLPPEIVFTQSGGIPFFAKVIGQHIVNGRQEGIFNSLKPHFNEIYSNLEPNEITLIRDVLGGKIVEENPNCDELCERGILRKDGTVYSINGSYFSTFIQSKLTDIGFGAYIDERKSLSDRVKEIRTLITRINNNSSLKNSINLFEVSNADENHYQDIENICLDREDLIRFASSLYLALFDRTQGDVIKITDGVEKTRTKTLERLPTKFRLKRTFIRYVGALRHHYGGHNTTLPGFGIISNQPTKKEVLSYFLGVENEPDEASDYISIQSKAVSNFIDYLVELDNFMKS